MSSDLRQQQSNSLTQNKKKRGDSKFNRYSPKYQCYCDKIYLSYPALYLHLKNKHPECFLNNRKIQVTKFEQLINQDGFRILRLVKQRTRNNAALINQKHIHNYPYANYDAMQVPHKLNHTIPPMNSRNYHLQNKYQPQKYIIPNYYSFDSQKQKSQKESKTRNSLAKNKQKQNLISILNAYFSMSDKMGKYEKRQILQIQLLFSLLIKCIRANSEKLRTKYQFDIDKDSDIVLSQKCQYLQTILPYFRNTYIKEYITNYLCSQKVQNVPSQQKLAQSFIKISKYFTNPQLAVAQVIKFQNWLLEYQIVQKIQHSPNF